MPEIKGIKTPGQSPGPIWNLLRSCGYAAERRGIEPFLLSSAPPAPRLWRAGRKCKRVLLHFPRSTSAINFSDFEKIELRAGTIVAAEDFPEAKKPAYKLTIDFGEFGVKKSSVQITHLYKKEDLVGTQVAAVLNFPAKQIGPFLSEVLTVGFPNDKGEVVLVRPDFPVPNGAKLF